MFPQKASSKQEAKGIKADLYLDVLGIDLFEQNEVDTCPNHISRDLTLMWFR